MLSVPCPTSFCAAAAAAAHFSVCVLAPASAATSLSCPPAAAAPQVRMIAGDRVATGTEEPYGMWRMFDSNDYPSPEMVDRACARLRRFAFVGERGPAPGRSRGGWFQPVLRAAAGSKGVGEADSAAAATATCSNGMRQHHVAGPGSLPPSPALLLPQPPAARADGAL